MGFATGDIYGSTSTTLKAAEMIVFSKKECNENLDKELNKNQKCKFLIISDFLCCSHYSPFTT